jgi:hypothetical protein
MNWGRVLFFCVLPLCGTSRSAGYNAKNKTRPQTGGREWMTS